MVKDQGIRYVGISRDNRLKAFFTGCSTGEAIEKLIQRWNKIVELLEDGFLVEENMKARDYEWLTSKVNRL